jgi:dihydrofolate synthase/folylpolyglutamate synthase
LFAQAALDVVVLEVGLGGRLDAVNILDADCAIITSVDVDHTDWLGDTREKIGFEKAHLYRPQRPAICGDPVPPQSLRAHAKAIGADLWCYGHDFTYSGNRQQWAYRGRAQRRSALAYPAMRGANQLLNAAAALAALESLRDRLPVPQHAVRLGLLQAVLPGRFQILPGQPTIILDVAHNSQAAGMLANSLDNMGFYPYTYAVFGMLQDKDVASVVARLHARIDGWFCAGLPGARGISAPVLEKQMRAALPCTTNAPLAVYPDPVQAFVAARKQAHDGDRIVVFGSFLMVAAILQALGRIG